MKKQEKLPKRLFVYRHAKSLPNQKLAEAEASGAETFELPMLDHLAPIVAEGHDEIALAATWLAQLPASERPTHFVSSTHTRTRQTTHGLVAGSGLTVDIKFDERLIEKKWGVIGGLTHRGFDIRFPEEAARRARQGDFRYRPGRGGESLRDLKKRLRPTLSDLFAEYEDENLALVTHSQVILVARQIIEGLNERQTQDLDESRKIPNCSVCIYVRKGNRLLLEREYFVA